MFVLDGNIQETIVYFHLVGLSENEIGATFDGCNNFLKLTRARAKGSLNGQP